MIRHTRARLGVDLVTTSGYAKLNLENNTNYQINLDIFQGPLDLLLHLIEQNEIDIYNIPIALITEKYLDYLHTIQLLNLEGVGDFLVMAATLMQIKAKMLLPQLQPET